MLSDNRYMLARMNNSTSIVECGTSFGLSTIYFALAVGQNATANAKRARGVLTIEKDPAKLARARETWAQAGPTVTEWIHAKEGDLLEILADGTSLPGTVDLLLLDGGRPGIISRACGSQRHSMDINSSTGADDGLTSTSTWILGSGR
jgi:predicted O-methyltransferase YrrM